MFDNDYRICFPKRNIFISRNHQWAFAAWQLGARSGALNGGATLLHVDAHLDDTWDGVIAEGLHEMKDSDDIMKVAGRLEIDNFIWAGFAAGTIDHIVYVCPKGIDDSDPFDLSSWNLEGEQLKPVKELLARKEYRGRRFESIAAFKGECEKIGGIPLSSDLERPVILDLDLDVFKLRPELPEDGELTPVHQIKEELRFLRDSHEYDMVTVAISPSFCGGDTNGEFLLRMFLETFGLELSEAETW
ncbi:UPF0489 family protein [Cohnella faecalis]|uniref:Uncharacterized protein n=1 Tax=Cohnella faecalis TaxID=2315694 RepID=A0A398CC89_9BACL|nr:UPF0489 family protein [Cohnella faecalis]RIE00776.1 hypothetical protein D3H35_26655 [Cohnella faecalis]